MNPMEPAACSVLAGDRSAYEEHRAAYLAQLVAPLDDMWGTFADQAEPFALRLGSRLVGSGSVDGEGQLLRLHVEPSHQHRATDLLRALIEAAPVACLIVATSDPVYLSAALDLGRGVESHSLLFAHAVPPEIAPLEDLRWAGPEDHGRLVDFQVEVLGAPRDFLEPYVRERLERREVLLVESRAGLSALGELRRDRQQPGVAQLGMIVDPAERGRGLGSRLMATLVTRSLEEGLRPHCSTEVANPAARRAIERAGFRANHRLLRVTV